MATDIYRIVISAVIAAILALMLKKDNPAFAVLITVVMTVLIVLMLLPGISGIFGVFDEITSYIDISSGHILIIVKIIGIAYTTEFGARICADADEAALAQTVELAGKISIMGVSAPLIISLLKQTVLIAAN